MKNLGVTLQAILKWSLATIEFYGSHVIPPKAGFYVAFMFYVYILQSLKDNSLYIGYSPDLRKRLTKHNKKQVPSTKNKTPYKLIYYEAYLNRQDATSREKFLKSGAGWRFIKKQLQHYLSDNK